MQALQPGALGPGRHSQGPCSKPGFAAVCLASLSEQKAVFVLSKQSQGDFLKSLLIALIPRQLVLVCEQGDLASDSFLSFWETWF